MLHRRVRFDVTNRRADKIILTIQLETVVSAVKANRTPTRTEMNTSLFSFITWHGVFKFVTFNQKIDELFLQIIEVADVEFLNTGWPTNIYIYNIPRNCRFIDFHAEILLAIPSYI